MKNKLLFMIGLCYALTLGFLTPLTGQSGSHILSELHDMLDPLDMTEVTSQVLYDRGLDMYNWQYYDGSVPSDSAAFSAGSWSWIYTQASTSFLPGYTSLPASSGYMDHMLNPSGANTITMASMWLDYHYLRPDAIDLNLLT